MPLVNHGQISGGSIIARPLTLPNVTISVVSTATTSANNTADNSGIRNISFPAMGISANRKSYNDKILIIAQALSSNTNAYVKYISLGNVRYDDQDITYHANGTGGVMCMCIFDDPGTSSENVVLGTIGSGSNSAGHAAVALRITNLKNGPKNGSVYGFTNTNGAGLCDMPSEYGGIHIVATRGSANVNQSPTVTSNGYVELVNRVANSAFGRGLSVWYRYSSEQYGVETTETWRPAGANTSFWSYLFVR